MRTRKALPVFLVIAVMALFLIPGMAMGKQDNGGGNGGASGGEKCPPPPPAGGTAGEQPPRKCGHASESGSASASESQSASASASESQSASASASESQSASASASESQSASASASASGGAPECEGFVHLADNVIIEDSAPLIDGVIGVHADLLPANASVNLARVCLGLGSVAALGVDCEGPVAVEPDGTSGLLICVEA